MLLLLMEATMHAIRAVMVNHNASPFAELAVGSLLGVAFGRARSRGSFPSLLIQGFPLVTPGY